MKKLFIQTALLILCGFVAVQITGAAALQGVTEKNEGENSPMTQDHAAEISDLDASKLLTDSRHRLFERRSVQADIVQKITLGGQNVTTEGSYASTAGYRYRLQYRIVMGELQGDFLEVCDGQLLHTRRQIIPMTEKASEVAQPEIELTRRDIQRIRREALGLKDGLIGPNLDDAMKAAEIGIGGLPAVLAVLDRTLLLQPVRTQTVAGREYYVLQGSMKPDQRSNLLAGLGGAAGQVEGLLPDLVRIYLERDSLFPEKFLYLKKSDAKGNLRPLITVEFTNVLLDQFVQDSQFVYMAPPGIEERDETQQFIDSMRQAALNPATAAPAKSETP